jgi:hypothetical protein
MNAIVKFFRTLQGTAEAKLTPYQKLVLRVITAGKGGFRRPSTKGQKKRNRKHASARLARVAVAPAAATTETRTVNGGWNIYCPLYDVFDDGSLRRRERKVRGKAKVKAAKRARRTA